jgi:CIC family chloride channel protein
MPGESPQPNVGSDPSAGLRARFWRLVPVVGIGTGIAAGLLMKLLRAVQHLAWPGYAGNFLQAVERTGAEHRVLVVLSAGVIVAALRLIGREATGGHSAELTERIWFHAGRLPVLRTLSKAVASMVIVGLGASVGREAAPKQVGATIASALGLGAGLPPAHRRLLVAIAAGAGMGAVYNVPFGGALFALEVLLGTLSLPLVVPALAISFTATAASWLLLPDRPTYHIPAYSSSGPLLAWAALLGPAAGLLSVLYIRLISRADSLKPRGSLGLLTAPLLALLALGLLSRSLPQLLGNGKDVVQLAFLGRMTAMTLFLVVLLKPLVTAGCLGTGAPGGLFTPTLTLGATFGALAGQALPLLGSPTPGGACALIGAAAVLAASTQGPVSSLVLVIELTHRFDSLIAPALVAVAGAVLVARRLESRSIYSGRIHSGTQAARASARYGPSISSAARYLELLHAVLRLGPNPSPIKVIDEHGEPIGEIVPQSIVGAAEEHRPLAIATARDFVRPQGSWDG